MKPQISFITINYNSSSYTKELIKSIQKESSLPYEIIVVDNHSKKDDCKTIEEFCATQQNVKLIKNETNCGFACGNMIGVQYAQAEYLFFINNDTKLLNDVSKILKEYLDTHADIALATASIVDENNNFVSSYKLFPSIIKELFGNTIARKVHHYPSNKVRLSEPTAVEVISGSCMFFKREAFFEIGGFDTHFFLYCEEEDISKRILNAGYKVFFIPDAVIFHKGGASAQRDYALIQEYYISYSYLIQKHFNIFKASTLYGLMLLKLLRRSFKTKYGFKLFIKALQGFNEKESLRYKNS